VIVKNSHTTGSAKQSKKSCKVSTFLLLSKI